MASKASTSLASSEEVLFQNDAVSLCLLVNRRARTMRVIDFRAGPSPAKRLFVMSLARREGVERVFVLVERDEATSWGRLGFEREGSIPGFYKRSDAFVLGTLVPALESDDPEESGLRPTPEVEAGDSAVLYQSIRKLAKSWESAPRPPVRLQVAREADARKALSAANRSGRSLTGFEPFGRDVEREYFTCTARGGFSLMASVEMQPCFNNALLELLTAPRTDKEAALFNSALGALCDELFEREVLSCFALTPVDQVALSACFVANGFRKTAVLRGHLKARTRRRDAFLWTRKLAQPFDS